MLFGRLSFAGVYTVRGLPDLVIAVLRKEATVVICTELIVCLPLGECKSGMEWGRR